MKRKLSMLFAAVALATVALVGCKGPTEEEYKQWAEENGYVVAPTDEEKAQWAEQNGYVAAPAALPAARLAGKTGYTTAESGVQINPSSTSGAVKLLDVMDREDAIYIDARGFGDYMKGHIEGFECLPYFDLIAPYTAGVPTLFNVSNGVVTANYEESVDVMKELLPEGRAIFLMCQSGGRIAGFMTVLEYCGYDMTKVYNVGGWGTVANDANNLGYPVSSSSVTTSVSFTLPSNLKPVKAA